MNREQDIQLTFNEIVRACDGDADWVVNVIEEEIISVQGSPRVPATALILQLLDELETLRKGRLED